MWIVPSSISQAFARESGCSTRPSAPDCVTSDTSLELRCAVSGKPTLRPASWRGWKNRPWSRALFGAAISQTSTAGRFVEWWTCSVRDCRASHTAWQESGSDLATSEATETEADPSRTSCASLPSVSPPWCSSRTSLPGFEAATSDQSGRSYADWVTRSKTRSLSLRRRLERATSASECSSWPTAQACDGDKQSHPRRDGDRTLPSEAKTWPTPVAKHAPRGKGQTYLSNGAGNACLATDAAKWPTPSARDHKGAPDELRTSNARPLNEVAKIWPTLDCNTSTKSNGRFGPNIREAAVRFSTAEIPDWKIEELEEIGTHTCDICGTVSRHNMTQPCPVCKRHTPGTVTYDSSLQAQKPTGEASQATSTRRLNPAFACWLMGWPWWWTRAEQISFAAQEMESYRSRLLWRLSSLCGE